MLNPRGYSSARMLWQQARDRRAAFSSRDAQARACEAVAAKMRTVMSQHGAAPLDVDGSVREILLETMQQAGGDNGQMLND